MKIDSYNPQDRRQKFIAHAIENVPKNTVAAKDLLSSNLHNTSERTTVLLAWLGNSETRITALEALNMYHPSSEFSNEQELLKVIENIANTSISLPEKISSFAFLLEVNPNLYRTRVEAFVEEQKRANVSLVDIYPHLPDLGYMLRNIQQ